LPKNNFSREGAQTNMALKKRKQTNKHGIEKSENPNTVRGTMKKSL